MVQTPKAVTDSGSKGLTSNAWPNDGLKAAKRWLKSHSVPAPPKKAALGLASRLRLTFLCPARSGGRKGDNSMIEEIKIGQTAEEATGVLPGQQAATVGARSGAERK